MSGGRFGLIMLMLVFVCSLHGCGDDRAMDYGSFTYAAPDGWSRYEPPQGITLAPNVVEFHPDVQDPSGVLSLEIRDVTDQQSRTERFAALYSRARERDWRLLSAEAERRGEPVPAFECASVSSVLRGPGETEGLSILFEQDGKNHRQLLYFIELPDGRRFRAEYVGVDPRFEEHRSAITASLETLAFAPLESSRPALSLEKTVASLKQQLDGDRLWLYDGQVEGQRLNDEHLVALAEPPFAEVSDLNLISGHNATMTGVDVTDDGLAYVKHLPLRSLCVRGSLVTDAGLVHLRELPLESLVLAETLVEGDGLEHLSGLQLKVLDLEGTQTNDRSLEYLVGMPLISVNLRNTQVTDAGLAMLQEEFPQAQISR